MYTYVIAEVVLSIYAQVCHANVYKWKLKIS